MIGTDNKQLQEILDGLKGVKQTSDGYMALCPAHDDKNPSLSISVGDNGIPLLYCHCGCEYKDIMTALGLQGNGAKRVGEVGKTDVRKEPGCLKRVARHIGTVLDGPCTAPVKVAINHLETAMTSP